MNDKLKPCCGECVNYEPIAIGINYRQFHDFCVEHQCHVNPTTDSCKYFLSTKERNRGAVNE